MYKDIKTIEEIDEKIKKLNYDSDSLQGQLSYVGNREFDRLQDQINLYDEWIEAAKKRKDEILQNNSLKNPLKSIE